MSTISSLWAKFTKSRAYRRAFVASHLKRSIPFQITAMRKERGWSQEKLAVAADLTQGVISRAEDPNYGNLTFNTILQVAAGFDVAFVGRFIPFSELVTRVESLSEESVQVPTFAKDAEPRKIEVGAHAVALAHLVKQSGAGSSSDLSLITDLRRNHVREKRMPAYQLTMPAGIIPLIGPETQIPRPIGGESYYSEALSMPKGAPSSTVYRAANSHVTGSLTKIFFEARS